MTTISELLTGAKKGGYLSATITAVAPPRSVNFKIDGSVHVVHDCTIADATATTKFGIFDPAIAIPVGARLEITKTYTKPYMNSITINATKDAVIKVNGIDIRTGQAALSPVQHPVTAVTPATMSAAPAAATGGPNPVKAFLDEMKSEIIAEIQSARAAILAQLQALMKPGVVSPAVPQDAIAQATDDELAAAFDALQSS